MDALIFNDGLETYFYIMLMIIHKIFAQPKLPHGTEPPIPIEQLANYLNAVMSIDFCELSASQHYSGCIIQDYADFDPSVSPFLSSSALPCTFRYMRIRLCDMRILYCLLSLRF